MEFQIGNVTIPGQVILGPMAGVSDLPFRLLCHEQGAALVCMEMVSAKAICYGNKGTAELMQTVPEEGKVSLQLFSHEPEFLAKAIDMIEEQPFDILDINMGCPVPKVTGNGEGSALMRDPALIEQLVKTAVSHTKRPVTVKIRKGYDDQHLNAVDCAKAAEQGGASAIAVHGRTRPQMYTGKADWNVIRDVASAVQIPVIGNGDVVDGPSARRMLDETGCAAVMIARGAQGNPWIFHEVDTYLKTSQEAERPSRREVIRMLMRHAEMEKQYKGEQKAIREMRGHAAWYLTGFPGASKLRNRINTVGTLAELEDLLQKEFPYAK